MISTIRAFFGIIGMSKWIKKVASRIYEFFYDRFVSQEKKDYTLRAFLESSIAQYPFLSLARPKNWPHHKKYGITNLRMNEFQEQRVRENLEGMNLPFILHNSVLNDDEKLKQVFISSLFLLDWFCKEMYDKPGARKVIEPLWTSTWDGLRFWGVLSEVMLAELLVRKGFSIDGFECTIPGSSKKADILTSFKGRRVWIDVEANALKPFEGTATELRNLVEARSRNKIQAKFQNLPENETGLVASIYRISNKINRDKFISESAALGPMPGYSKNTGASIYWIIQGRPDGSKVPFRFHLVDSTVKVVPL